MKEQLFSLQQIAEQFNGSVIGDPNYQITGIASLENAQSQQLSFLANSKYINLLKSSKAGAVLIDEHSQACGIDNAIIVDNPYLVFAKLSQLFAKSASRSLGVAPTAIVDETAVIEADVSIGDYAVIKAGAHIGKGAIISSHSVLAENVSVGAETQIYPNVSVYADVKIGRRCIIHSGAVIGADGFGFAPDKDGWCKIAHLGSVVIGDDVEVGAGTTIDRGALDDTVIADGVKLDNQVLVAHNVKIGQFTAIAGCTAIAGSAKIGARCQIAGGVGITGHLSIADGSFISAMSLVSKTLKEKGSYSSGTSLEPTRSWRKNVVRFRQLDELNKRVKELEDKVREIEGHS